MGESAVDVAGGPFQGVGRSNWKLLISAMDGC